MPWLRWLVARHFHGPLGSIPGQSMQDLWWTKRYWGRFFSGYFAFPPVGIIWPIFHTHWFIYYWCAISITDSVVKQTHSVTSHLLCYLMTWLQAVGTTVLQSNYCTLLYCSIIRVCSENTLSTSLLHLAFLALEKKTVRLKQMHKMRCSHDTSCKYGRTDCRH